MLHSRSTRRLRSPGARSPKSHPRPQAAGAPLARAPRTSTPEGCEFPFTHRHESTRRNRHALQTTHAAAAGHTAPSPASAQGTWRQAGEQARPSPAAGFCQRSRPPGWLRETLRTSVQPQPAQLPSLCEGAPPTAGPARPLLAPRRPLGSSVLTALFSRAGVERRG